MPEPPPDDPITSSSFSNLLLITSVLLVLAMGWALYDEVYGLRPWRVYQHQFTKAYSGYLQKKVKQQQAAENEFFATAEYKKLLSDAAAADQAAKPQDEVIEREIALIDQQRTAITDVMQTARGKVGSLIYQYEVVPASDKNEKNSRLRKLNEAKAETYEVEWPVVLNQTETRKLNYDQFNETFQSLLSRRAALVAKRGEIDAAAKDARKKLNDYVVEKLPGLGSAQLQGLLNATNTFDERIIQVNVNPPGAQINFLGGVGLVDRCQSCHLGTNQTLVPLPMTLTKADLSMASNKDVPFTSHSDPELLQIHNVETFGCSPCHGGNGRALDSVTRAHGRYEHWLWPLYYPENYQAGCQNCHSADMVTEHATVLSEGKQLYRLRGCVGCHKFQGFDDQDDQLVNTRQTITQLTDDKTNAESEIPRLNKLGDQAPDNTTAEKYYTQATNLQVRISNLESEMQQLEERSYNLLREVKKVGPDLKEARVKLRKEWIPQWLGHTHEFRPTTKMPQFRLEPDEIQAIAAFIWQSGLTGPPLQQQKPGDPGRGKQLFEQRGCLGCHSIGEGAQALGAEFAANLSRVGEKENYDYVVRWVHNPRERTRPYCPYEKRDLGPEDYAQHNLPYVFDLEHSRCPNDGHELVVQQPTVMPNLRLSWDDARDIASYLMSQKRADATYADASFMEDPKLKVKGKELVQHYGCAGCHEISGLEDEGRIGTELTNEGSKPIERFDFGLYTKAARRGMTPDGKHGREWYDAKGFFEQKLANPAIFQQGKYQPNPMDRLRMPKPNLRSQDELEALTTMLLGSVDPTLPASYMYKPSDRRRAIQEGWWIVTKYNCIGCHQIGIGQKSALMGLPQYQGEGKANLPPVLTSEGARVSPEWLKRFLANPSLSTTDTNRNGIRSYLQVRMPTFSFSDDEIRKLVMFFGAISYQPQPFIPEKVTPLTDTERVLARDIFTSPAAPCLKCHATGNEAHDKNATAPNFLLARDRLQPPWTERWIIDPARIIPGTSMPSGLFKREGNRWVFNGPLPSAASQYHGDFADLLVRYMFELTPQEQSMLLGRTPAARPSGKSSGQ